MSSNIIPMLPSTPPPLEESAESDDDELGNFTSVLGQYDSSLAEVPRSACDEPQIKSDKNNCTNHYVQSRNDINIQKTEIHIGNSYKHFADFPDKSIAIAKDKSSDDEIKPSKKSPVESIKNGKVERHASETQEKIQTDNSGRFSPILNDTESQNDSPLRIKQGDKKDEKVLTAKDEQLVVCSSVKSYVTLSDNEKTDIQESNRTATSVIKEVDDMPDTYATFDPTKETDEMNVAPQETEEVIESERISVPSQQYRNKSDSEDQDPFILPLASKPIETVSFQQKSNFNSLEPSPVSASENFTSMSDVSSEFSNFETAKSSPNSVDACDKEEIIDKSEIADNDIQDYKEKESEIRSKDSMDENSCNSVSPLVFQENALTEINSEADDDFADFQQADDEEDFSPMTVMKTESRECNVEELCTESAVEKPTFNYEDTTYFAETTSDNDDFADFESAQDSSWSHTQDDFANFEQASFENQTQKNDGETQVSLNDISDKGKGKVTQLVFASFPTIYEEKTPETDEVFPFKSETDYMSMLLRGRSRRLWDRLQDLDTTPAMLFRWGSSQCFQAMLHALNIDSHSILRNPSVPIYASSLGLLEPTKGPHSPKHQTNVNKHILLQETVPPAEFDWSDSGLINPLEAAQAAGLFDLDFFTAQNNMASTANAASSELEAELFGPSTVCAASGDKDNNRSPLITQILASSKSTIFPSAQRQCSRPSELSEEVVRVLDKLPDLSFMQAKVLMFPIHDLSDH